MKVRSLQCQVVPPRVQTSTPPFDMTLISLSIHTQMHIQYELRHTFKIKLIEYVVFARRLRCSKHGCSSNTSLIFNNHPSISITIQYHQFRIHRMTKDTMASVHDQLQCCLLVPKTNENKNKTPTTHTRSKTKTDEALSESTQKTRPTVSANPHPPMEDRRVRQAKLSSVQKNTQTKLHIRGVTNLERDYIIVPRKLSFRQAIY